MKFLKIKLKNNTTMHLNNEKLNMMRIRMYHFFIVIGNNKVNNDLWTPTIEFLKMVPYNVYIKQIHQTCCY